MYVFEDLKGNIYNTPDAYVISHKDRIILWGDKLKVWPVYCKGCPVISSYQEIKAMFYHEGSSGSLDSIYWLGNDYDTDNNIELVNQYKIVCFDISPDCPKYFRSKDDLVWYITNIYDLYQPFVNDEYPSED
jgi:hypothetical protein